MFMISSSFCSRQQFRYFPTNYLNLLHGIGHIVLIHCKFTLLEKKTVESPSESPIYES